MRSLRRLAPRALLCLLLLPACDDSGGANASEQTSPNPMDAGTEVDSGADAADAASEIVPPTEARLELETTALGVSQATDFVFLPGAENEILVSSKTGSLHRLSLSNGEAQKLDSVELPGVFTGEGCGVLGMALDPDFTSNHFAYVGRCVDELTTTLARYRIDDLAAAAVTEAEIMTVSTDERPPEFWHRWGSMGFEPDGVTMWALLGDLFFRQLAADPRDKPGSLLRFLPSREEGGFGYTPAEGNAFESTSDGDPAVYAYGLRSPWRGYRDRHGRFWIGDVGEYAVEEVNVAARPGENFGWPEFEGDCTEDCGPLKNGVTTWDRDSAHPYILEDPDTEPATRRAAWVGVLYESPAVDRYYGLLDDVLLFGDFFLGWVRGLKIDAAGEVEWDRLVGHLPSVVSVRIGPDGFIYFLTHDGELHRAVQPVD